MPTNQHGQNSKPVNGSKCTFMEITEVRIMLKLSCSCKNQKINYKTCSQTIQGFPSKHKSGDLYSN